MSAQPRAYSPGYARTRAKYRALYAVAARPQPTPLDWALAHGVIRTADGRSLRFGDVARDYQIALLADRHPRRIVAKSRQIGISQTVAFEVAHEALGGGTAVVISRNGEQAALFLDYVYTALSDCDHPPYTSENAQSLEMAHGGRVITQPATRSAGRGIPATLVVIDEQAWQEYARLIYTAVLPMLAETGGRLVIMSTPQGQDNLFAELWHAAQRERGEPSGRWSPHFLPWQVHPVWRETPGWEDARRDELGDEAFAQEHGVDFLRSGANVFDPAEIERMWRLPAFPAPDPTHAYVKGWDIARKQDAFVGFVFDISTSPFQVAHFERHLRLSYPEQASRIEEVDRAYLGETWVESNGVGDPLIQFLGINVREFTTTALTKRNAIDALKLLMQREELISPRIPEWARELGAYQRNDANLMQDTVMAAAIVALAAGRPVQATYAVGGSRLPSATVAHQGGGGKVRIR